MPSADLVNALKDGYGKYQSGDLDGAEATLKPWASDAGGHADAFHLLGLVAFERGQLSRAQALIEGAITRNSKNHIYFNNLALVLSANGQPVAALKAANKAAFLAPGNADTLTTRGLMLERMNRIDQAIDVYRNALDRNPEHLQANINLGLALLTTGDYTAAEETFRNTLNTSEDAQEALLGLAKTFVASGRFAEAITVVEEHPSEYRQGLPTQLVLAEAYLGDNQAHHAKSILNQAVHRFPGNATAWSDLGYVNRALADADNAIVALERALALDPGHGDAADNLGQVLLSTGNFERGWKLYGKRSLIIPTSIPQSMMPIDAVTRELISEKKVVCWTEQGLGDQILQSSLIADLAEVAPHVRVLCSERLVELFQMSFPDVEVIAADDFHVEDHGSDTTYLPLLHTASCLRQSTSSFPAHPGYLSPPDVLVTQLKAKYGKGAATTPLLVGLSWHSGNKRYGTDNSIPLENWKPVFDAARESSRAVVFVACQFGASASEVSEVARKFQVPIVCDTTIDHGGNMTAVAAQVAAMDIILSTSTTTAQLAGALGRPTIHMTAAGLACGWYWMASGSHTPWYPSMTLVRRNTYRSPKEQVTGAANLLSRLMQ